MRASPLPTAVVCTDRRGPERIRKEEVAALLAAARHNFLDIILCRPCISERGADSGVTQLLFLSFPCDQLALSQKVESVYFNKFPLHLDHNYVSRANIFFFLA